MIPEKMDLGTLEIKADGNNVPQMDYSCEDTVNARVIFREHKEELLKYINKYNSILGCVAWLTDYDLLKALATKKIVSIIVQKEDFLRPDIDGGGKSKKLSELYNSLPTGNRLNLPLSMIAGELSLASDPTLEAIRCMGNHNKDKSPAFPRMHHKFLIFTNDFESRSEEDSDANSDDLFRGFSLYDWKPSKGDCVWTGSYNLSQTATRSLENAVVLQSPRVVEAYVNEWDQIVALSEPLDWKSTWCNPQWFIGT